LRNTAWPYSGAIGIRERADLHVIDAWTYLGTARTESEVHELLHARRRETDRSLYDYLARTLPRLPRRRIVPLETSTPISP
jgi:DNA polymerase III subunit epsilon